MALNLRFGHGRTLPEFREGSELVEGLRSVGLRNRQDSTSASYIDINQFENNWEDLDEDFSEHEILEKIELEKVPHVKDIYSYDEKVEPSENFGRKNNRDNNLTKSKAKGQGLTSTNGRGQGLSSTNVRGQGLSSTDVRGQGLSSTDVRGQGLSSTNSRGQGSDSIVGTDRSEAGGDIGCCGYILWFLSIVLILLTLPFSLCLSMKVVQEYERAVIFRLGRLVSGGAKGPGLFFIIPCIDSYTKVDMRTVSFDVPPQEVLTKDSVTVAVDAVVYYRIQNAAMSITNVEDSNRSTRLLAQTTLRNVLGTKNLSEILSDRESISHVMQTSLDEATDPWGVKVERVEVKDVRLPVQLQRAMAAEAEAAREARAKVIAAEGEQKASRALKEAADVMSESPAAIQLRYLQTLNTISAEKNSTIIFPLPIDLMQAFMRRGGGGGERETVQAHF